MGARELFALGLRDHALRHRFLPVVQARGMHFLRDVFGAGHQQKRLFQPGDTAVVVDMGKI